MARLPTRVLVVDDYEPWHRFYTTELQKQSDLQIIAHVSDGLEAVQQAQELQPDVILLDIGLPTLSGIEVARRIGGVSPASKILFVSENRSADILEAALSNGAGGYVLKSDAAGELLPAIKAVLEGKRFVSASLAGRVLATSKTGASHVGRATEDNPYLRFAKSPYISEFLAAVIVSTAADFGVVQLYDSKNHVLRIVAQHGFERELLNNFNTLGNNVPSACNESMNERTRIVVTDVATDPHFSDYLRGLLLRAEVHSLQSTPLIDSAGKLVGVVSTHYLHPGIPSPDVLKHVDNLATSFLTKIRA
jgi:DNA-binding NarL/FixJ family response regulator